MAALKQTCRRTPKRRLLQSLHENQLAPVFFALVLFAFAACNSDSAQTKKLTAADLQKLHWIEGTWRGTGDVDKPFFERYRFEGDSLLLIDSFEDATLAKVTDTSRYELKDGEFGGGSEGHRSKRRIRDLRLQIQERKHETPSTKHKVQSIKFRGRSACVPGEII